MREILLLVCLVFGGDAQAVGARGGCWALNEAQFYATQERRVLQALAEFKVIGAADKLSLPTGEKGEREGGREKRERKRKILFADAASFTLNTQHSTLTIHNFSLCSAILARNRPRRRERDFV
jgi:hypothetical protein